MQVDKLLMRMIRAFRNLKWDDSQNRCSYIAYVSVTCNIRVNVQLIVCRIQVYFVFESMPFVSDRFFYQFWIQAYFSASSFGNISLTTLGSL